MESVEEKGQIHFASQDLGKWICPSQPVNTAKVSIAALDEATVVAGK